MKRINFDTEDKRDYLSSSSLDSVNPTKTCAVCSSCITCFIFVFFAVLLGDALNISKNS